MEKGGGTCHHFSLVGIKAMTVPRIRMNPKYSYTRHPVDILVTWYLVSILGVGGWYVYMHAKLTSGIFLDCSSFTETGSLTEPQAHQFQWSSQANCLRVSALSLMLGLRVDVYAYPACTWILGI